MTNSHELGADNIAKFDDDNEHTATAQDTEKSKKSSLLGKVSSAIGATAEQVKDQVTGIFTKDDDTTDNEMNRKIYAALDANERAEMSNEIQRNVAEALGTDARHLKKRAGVGGRFVIHILTKAAEIQQSAVEQTIDWLRAKNPTATPEELQDKLDNWFQGLSVTSGGAAGMASAVPGIGLATGTAAIAAESVLFLDLATLYTLGSAYLRGADLSIPERRQAFVLLTLAGTQGTAIVDAAVGDIVGGDGTRSAMSVVTGISKMNAAKAGSMNNKLVQTIGKVGLKKLLPASIGKLLPFGLGAAIGAGASWKLSSNVIKHTDQALGTLPAQFPTPAPTSVPDTPEIVKQFEKARKKVADES
ncbi:hypothetical protein ACFPVT_00865 [Corynebacterium choanae]|uniref:EcsC protein family protein n=1 Tax=Corynebacterium choanae TaxID=1862358 RepID=A0A3G6JB55_9CORY|nr:hypothetical protein [Corynebacterium choanae]AZA13274.1 hypothetical protein CCHOA_04325 [Corynebacterium choanae]